MQIELAKTVASRPATAFAIVANVVDWPEIISSIKSIEVLTPGPIRAGRRLQCDARVGNRNDRTSPIDYAFFRSRPTTPAGRALQPLMSPFMEITLRDELERDLSDLATAISRHGPH
jgi:hypothetical protein